MNSDAGQKKKLKSETTQTERIKTPSRKNAFSAEAFKTDGCDSRLLSWSAAQEAEKLSVDFWCLTGETCHMSRV